MDEWQSRLDGSENGRTTYGFISDVRFVSRDGFYYEVMFLAYRACILERFLDKAKLDS